MADETGAVGCRLSIAVARICRSDPPRSYVFLMFLEKGESRDDEGEWDLGAYYCLSQLQLGLVCVVSPHLRQHA
jgi:hypothetical protein